MSIGCDTAHSGCTDGSADLPPTSNVIDPSILRMQRLSDSKAAKLLDITIAREDTMRPTFPTNNGDEDGSLSHISAGAAGQRLRRRSMPQLFIAPTAFLDPHAYSTVEGDASDALPLVENDRTRKKGKGRAKLGSIFGNLNLSFRGRKTSKAAGPSASKATLPSLLPIVGPMSSARNPFSDKYAMDCGADNDWDASAPQDGVDCDDGGEPDGPPSSPEAGGSQWAMALPRTPEKKHRTSVPSTPSPRSSARGRRTPRTPASAKSWLSELSTTSELSAVSSMRRKKAKRKARMASQMKSIQVLGAEAVGAVAQAAMVKETKLRYRMFDRQLRDCLRRNM